LLSNAGPIRQRQFYKKQYEDLLKKGGNAEELAKTTEYGRGLASAKQAIADAAVTYGSSVNATDLDVLAGQIYDLANEGNAPIIKAAIRAKISYKPGAILGRRSGSKSCRITKDCICQWIRP
jgi:nicotinamide riboside kinase